VVFKKGHVFTPKNNPKDIWKRIVGGEDGKCWECNGGLSRGYGAIMIDYKMYYIHRLAYIDTYGPIPEGMLVLHKCNNPKCCNPKHLYLGTDADNMNQMVKAGRSSRGENRPLSKLKEKDVLKIRLLFSTGNYYQADLARMFGVAHTTIRKIILRDSWRHI